MPPSYKVSGLGRALHLIRSVIWLPLAALAILMPRNHSFVLIYGRDKGKFLDNCKHLYCHCVSRAPASVRYVYVAHDQELALQLRATRGEAVVYGSLAEFTSWLRAGTIVVDSVDWSNGYRFAASRGASLMQMWHGVPLKMVQMARVRQRSRKLPIREWAYTFYLWASGRMVTVDWLLSTSPFISEKALHKSFFYRNILHSGYPRNDALLNVINPMSWINVDKSAAEAITSHRRGGESYRVAIFAPTFREGLEDPFASERIDLKALSAVAVRLNLLLLIKLHPWMHGRVKTAIHPALHFVDPESDIYPLLPQTDFLITDYSSIFFDFLLLDRPILFFPYDLERYLAEERPMYFDYDRITPGPKATTIRALVRNIEEATAGRDIWRNERRKVCNLVFQNQDGRAAERVVTTVFSDADRA